MGALESRAEGQATRKAALSFIRQEELINLILQTGYSTRAKPSMVAITETIGDACEDEGLGAQDALRSSIDCGPS